MLMLVGSYRVSLPIKALQGSERKVSYDAAGDMSNLEAKIFTRAGFSSFSTTSTTASSFSQPPALSLHIERLNPCINTFIVKRNPRVERIENHVA
jgi:hypothetical protein